MTSAAALRGYLLEEVLAKLLADSGYSLLTRADQDRDALKAGKHGLLIRGRGANHQADALGNLQVPVPFSLPVRLFAEAKFRETKIGLTDVRNALAVVTDVNERHSTDGARRLRLPFQRYHYRYSLFSMSGFTGPAEDFALAHQISLVDLQGPAFDPLRKVIQNATEELLELRKRSNVIAMPTGQIRTAFRVALGTMDKALDAYWADSEYSGGKALNPATAEPVLLPERSLQTIADTLAEQIRESGLVLGFLKAPFLLALQPDDVHEFHQWLRGANAVQDMYIRFARGGPTEGDWVIVPEGAPRGVILRFGVPRRLLTWLVNGDAVAADLAAEVKREFFSSVVIFDRNGRNVELRLRHRHADGFTRPTGHERPSYAALRQELTDPTLPPAPQRSSVPPSQSVPGSWTAVAAQSLLRSLEAEGWRAQAQVLHEAAHTGSITRREVIVTAGLAPKRTLHGFLRPIQRITKDLMRAGLLAPEAEPALARTKRGRELTYIMSPDLAAILRREHLPR